MRLDVDDQSPGIEVYRHYPQVPRARVNLVARSVAAPDSVVVAMQQAVWSVDPNLPIADIRSMQQLFDDDLGAYSTLVGLLLVLATIAISLSCVGLYGVVTYSVAMRTQEIGIRLALGARAGDVLHLVLRRGVIITGVGVIIGLGIAALLAKLLESLLIGVSVTDPVTYLGLGALLIAVTLIASYLPARRATKIDPLKALRYE